MVKFEILLILKFFSKSFEAGIFIFKDDKKCYPNNYHPIFIYRYIRLFDLLENNNLLYDGQYGFRRYRDTETAVVDVLANIKFEIDTNKKCSLLSLDL